MDLIERGFDMLKHAKTLEEIKEIPFKLGISKKNQIDPEKYPKLNFKISKVDIGQLKTDGHIDCDNNIIDPHLLVSNAGLKPCTSVQGL